jgi:hypothetical protein
MHPRAFLFVALSSASFLAVTACTPAAPNESDGADTAEGNYTVSPTGGTGQLRVSVPAGALAATTHVIARRSDGAGTTIELTDGVAKPVSPGTYCVYTRITGSNPYDVQFETQADCTLSVVAGATLDYALGAVKLGRSRDELLLGLDVGKDGLYTDEYVRRMLATTTPIAHALGAFEYTYVSISESSWSSSQYKTLDSVSFSVTAGATTNVDILDTTGKWALRIIPATPRTLPNAQTQISARVEWSSYAVQDSWVDIGALAKPLLVRAKAQSNLAVSSPSAQSLALTQPMSDKPLARLDVEDVSVTMPDGTTKPARGTVQTGGLTFSTNAGIDLLPGTYSVTITYAHPADGAKLVTTATAVLTP